MNVTTRERGNIPNCHPAPHDHSLLEITGVGAESIASQYSQAICRYLLPIDDDDHISHERMWRVMSSRKVLSKI